MLSSVPGARVTGVKIKGVSHEYATLPGIKDSILDIMLNLKGLILETNQEGIAWIQLVKNKSGIVTAKDIKLPSEVTIVNPDMYITEIDRDGFELSMDIRIEHHVGYKSLEELKKDEDDVNILLIDANFSPVLNVSYDVIDLRHGDITNLDQLTIQIKTNGIIAPKDVLQFSGTMLDSYFSMFAQAELQIGGQFISDIKELLEKEKNEVKEEMEKESYTPIEIMGLSPRTLNALVNGEILSVEQLVKCTEAKLSSIKGFGKKAMTEVRAALAERGLKLLGDD